MQTFKEIPSWLWWILGANLFVNLLQAGLTPLDPDEAYYRMYALKPALGYFDHPPVVALLIKAGTLILPGTVGIRAGTTLLNTITLLLAWILAGKPADKNSGVLLMAILLSMPFLQVYGFIATPDAPLLCFSILYMLIFDRALTTNKMSWFVLLGVCMAALLYSKYHGLLVILFLLFAHFRLLLNYRFYLAGIIGIALFLPHLYWQFIHDFPSFRYHLKGRDDPYELKHTITYLINQMVMFSPLLLPYTFGALKNFRQKDSLSRSFRFLIYGFLLFFFYTTFKGHVEPQWTAVLSIPLSFFVWKYLILKEAATQKKALRLAVTTIIVFGIARLLLMTQPEIGDFNLNMKHEQWVRALQTEAAGVPVIFQNSYRDASIYSYYSGEHAYTITDMHYRKNQFDIWDDEKYLFGKKVLIAGNRSMHCASCREKKIGNKHFVLSTIDSFQPFQKTALIPNVKDNMFYKGKEITIDIIAYNPYPNNVEFSSISQPLHLEALFYNGMQPAFQCNVTIPENILLPPKDSIYFQGTFSISEEIPSGKYGMILGVGTSFLPPSKNSKREVEVMIR